MDLVIGKRYRLKDFDTIKYNEHGTDGTLCGWVHDKIVTLKRYENSLKFYETGSYHWEEEHIEEIKEILDSEINIKDETIMNFKVGDIVNLKELYNLDNICYYYTTSLVGINKNYTILFDSSRFRDFYRNYYNKPMYVQQISLNDLEEQMLTIRFNKDSELRFPAIIFKLDEEATKSHKDKEEWREKNKMVIENSDEIEKEMISKVDVKLFKKIISASYEMKSTTALGIDLLLQNWAKNKKEIYLALGRNLELSKEINMQKTKREMKSELEDFIKKYPIVDPYFYGISSEGLIDNEVIPNYDSSHEINTFLEKNEGIKITKLINKIVDVPIIENYKKLTEEEKELYLSLKSKVSFTNKIADDFSKIIANTKIKGKVCISINPIDYLLMSANKSGWDSCYKLFSQSGNSNSCGSWSNGIFSYLQDKATLIAYKCSNQTYEYKVGKAKFEANSKNWRQLIYLDTTTNCFVTSRQYTEVNDDISKIAREILEEALSKNLGLENSWKTKSFYNKTNKLKWVINKIKETVSYYSYNDILHSNQLKGAKFVYNKNFKDLDKVEFNTEHEIICLKCGEKLVTSTLRPFCNNCR